MKINSLLVERLAVLANLKPSVLAASATTSYTSTSISEIPTSGTALSTVTGPFFGRFLAISNITGTVTGTDTVTVALIKSPNTSFTSVTTISSNVYVGTNANNVVDLQELNDVYEDTTNPFVAVRISSTGGATVSSVIVGGDEDFGPASQFNIAAVGTIQHQ